MSSKKRKQREKTGGKPEQTPAMELSQKFKMVMVICMLLTAAITCILLAVFF